MAKKSLVAVSLVGWSVWAGYTVILAGYWFGVLLPIAGICLMVGALSRTTQS